MSDIHEPANSDDLAHPAWPATVDEAVDRLVATLSDANKQAIREVEGLFHLHFGLGMWIRNFFGLWGGNEALLRSCARRRGGSDDPNIAVVIHPDSASTVILEALQERLLQEDAPRASQ